MLASSWLALRDLYASILLACPCSLDVLNSFPNLWVSRTGVGSIRGPMSWEVKQVFPSEWLTRLPILLGWRQLRSLAL